MNTNQKTLTTPWAYIPTAYFLEGLPYAIINILAGIIYVKMDVPIAQYAFWTGLMGIPWIIKMFWAPLVDGNKTKRFWVVFTQYAMAVLFAVAALSLRLDNFFTVSALCFFAGAFLSATYDIALDGYYLIALDSGKQAGFVGIRTAVYRLAMLFCSGPLVIFAGYIERRGGSTAVSMAAALGAAAALMFLMNTYDAFILPRPQQDKPQKGHRAPLYFDAFYAFLTQQGIIYILIFMLFYRFGDALLGKMLVPFLLRAKDTGALAVPTDVYGLIKGTFGLIAVLGGNICGGFLLAKYGLKKCIWFFAAFLVLPNFLYAWLSACPDAATTPLLGAVIIFEHLGDGLGFMAFTYFIVIIARGEYKTSFYAIATGIMAFGTMIPPMFSGKLFVLLGSNYARYFIVVSVISLLTFAVVPLVYKIKKVQESDAEILAAK
ncbi:MAG: MFS transporter [Elusimicrobiota bacterium]|jgi:PAT family beta-lactamase induction signal transducer AmpG|nr:MFS transporter [Elusimicrobiota bacterium]